MSDEIDLLQKEPWEIRREQYERRSRRNKMIGFLILVMVLGYGYREFHKTRREAAESLHDLGQLNDLRVLWIDLADLSGTAEKGKVVVEFSEATVILKGPEIMAYMMEPNFKGNYATLYVNGSAEILSPKELGEKIIGHTIVNALIPETRKENSETK